MNLTKKERKKKAELVRAKRANRRKEKKAEVRKIEEQKMAEYLLEHGWKCSGPMQDVWTISGWNKVQDCKASLRNAYRIQQKLELQDYQKPASIDDDLGSLILGD